MGNQPAWRKSSHSGGNGGDCVEVASLGHRAGVRDSKLGDASPVLRVPAGSLVALLDGIRDGQFD